MKYFCNQPLALCFSMLRIKVIMLFFYQGQQTIVIRTFSFQTWLSRVYSMRRLRYHVAFAWPYLCAFWRSRSRATRTWDFVILKIIILPIWHLFKDCPMNYKIKQHLVLTVMKPVAKKWVVLGIIKIAISGLISNIFQKFFLLLLWL